MQWFENFILAFKDDLWLGSCLASQVLYRFHYSASKAETKGLLQKWGAEATITCVSKLYLFCYEQVDTVEEYNSLSTQILLFTSFSQETFVKQISSGYNHAKSADTNLHDLLLFCLFSTYRHVAYCNFVRWIWRTTGRKNRKILPACLVAAIRSKFPSEQYAGFKYAV